MTERSEGMGYRLPLGKLLEKKITLCYLYIMEHTLSKENNPIFAFLLLRNLEIFTNEEKEDSVS